MFIFLFLFACIAPDFSLITGEICGEYGEGEFHEGFYLYPEVSEECRLSILSDFNADEDFDVALESTEDWDSAGGTLVGGAWSLLHYSWDVDGESVSGNGHDLYNRSVKAFRKVSSEEVDGEAAYNRGILKIDTALPPISASLMIVHEMRHGEGEKHVKCWDGVKDCDKDYTGAYGSGLDMLDSIHVEDDYFNDYIDAYAGEFEKMIVE